MPPHVLKLECIIYQARNDPVNKVDLVTTSTSYKKKNQFLQFFLAHY